MKSICTVSKLISISFFAFLFIFSCQAVLAEQTGLSDKSENYRPDRKPSPQWYKSEEAIKRADNILSWQSLQGSWPKNVKTSSKPFVGDSNSLEGTFDNGATTGEIRFLSHVFLKTKDPRYEKAVLKAIGHILMAQYPNGGWPQFYPPSNDYHRRITFNDDCMVRLIELMRDVAVSEDFNFIGTQRRKAAQDSFNRGVECIINCQIIVNDKPAVWCQQHDELDFSPKPGRAFEPVALCSAESAGILKLLMSIENPQPKVVAAIEAGVKWFESAKIIGIHPVWVDGDFVVKQDSNAPPVWARFYEIETNRPIFEGRDGIIKYSLAEVEKERRGGYAWYGSWGDEVAKEYANWKEKRHTNL